LAAEGRRKPVFCVLKSPKNKAFSLLITYKPSKNFRACGAANQFTPDPKALLILEFYYR
jgi:hypothetical protein